ncbi:cell division protein FtsH [Rubripirellula lacrimiformis]|uniref:cell division protein FtsH n=1 Tax=Rubripirellula lacrimiformis TaxID=1930273 RepID=UPI0011A62054|nr:cell division protein FtsH [Rubripirellula lacrimiformis]
MNQDTDQDDETLTSYHEAGHAVVAHSLGATVDSMQLWGEADDWLPERFGDCRVNWGPVDPNLDWQRQREIMTYLAGPVAEMIYRGEPLHPALYGPWQDDWQRAMATCEAIIRDPQQRTLLLEKIIVSLHQHLQNEPYWPAIAGLADELAAHEMLEADQVAETLEFWLRR